MQKQCDNQSKDRPSDQAATTSSAQMMDILEHMSDALYTVDENWCITYINRKTEEFWGRRREELIGCNVWAAFPQAVGTPPYHAYLDAMQTRQPVTFDYFSPIIHRWLAVRAYPHGAGLAVHFSDITARKQAELDRERLLTALEESTRLFQRIAETSPDALYVFDLATQHFVYISPRSEEVIGYRAADLMALDMPTVTQLWHPDDLSNYTVHMRKLQQLADGEILKYENRALQPDGTYRWLCARSSVFTRAANGQVQQVVGVMQDITAQKRAGDALRASEERFRRYFELGLVGMTITSPTKGWLEVNDQLCTSLGYERQELLHMTWAELTHPDDLAKDVSLFNQVLAGEIDGYSLDKRFIRKDGQIIHATIAANGLRRADGTIEYFMCLLQDITARKAAEAAEREQRRFAEALRDSLAALTGSLTVEGVMQQILNAAAIVVPSEAGSIILFEGEYGHVAYQRGFTPEAQTFFKDYRFPIASMAHENVFAAKQAYCVSDTQTTSDWISLPASAWIRASIGIPITMRGEVMGLLAIDSAIAHHFQPADMEKLQAFAHYAGLALENAYHVAQLEQKVAARTVELNDAKDRVEVILNNSPDGILLAYPDLRIKQTNAAFHRLFASMPDDADFGSLYDLIHTDDVARVQLVIETALQEQAGQPVEMRCYRKNGTLFDAELSISRIAGSVTGSARFVCTIRDITERKQAQTALAEERNLLRTLIDTIPDYIYIKDTDHRFRLSNIAAARAVGVTPEEMIGQDDVAFFPTAMARQFQADEAQLFRSGVAMIDHEERAIGPDGNMIWASTTKVPLRNLNGELVGLVGISRDISAHKERGRQLRYYASLQENISDAVITTDLDLHIQSWNRAAETIYGWRSDEVIGRSVVECLSTRYASAAESDESAQQTLLKHGQWRGEIMHGCRDGTQIYILSAVTLLKDEQGMPFGMVAINRDITELKRADAALHEQRDFLQLVINSVPDLITVNDEAGRFQMVNEPAAQIYGLTSAQMVGKTDAEVNPNPGEVAFFLQTDQETLDSGQIVFIPEQTIQGRDYQTSKIPLKTPSGRPSRLLAVSFDITVRKQAETALQQALQSEKELGELKSRFFAMASHEFRQPLTTILLLTEALRNFRQRLTEPQIEQRLGKLHTQVTRLNEIMDDVLQLTQLEARRAEFNPVALDLDTLGRSILDEFQSQPGATQRLAYTCDDRIGKVHLDKKLMRQLITNLVSNAMKYSAADKTVWVSLTATGEELALQVRDEGIGIPAADLNYLFEPFHRAANVGTIAGTGLGLTIAKEAVELHGGTITIESQSGVGTTFIVRIPRLPNAEKWGKN